MQNANGLVAFVPWNVILDVLSYANLHLNKSVFSLEVGDPNFKKYNEKNWRAQIIIFAFYMQTQ